MRALAPVLRFAAHDGATREVQGETADEGRRCHTKGLEIRDIPQPKPKPNEVLTRVRAASLNRADLNAARGAGGHGALGATVGLDWAGEVVEVGSEVKGGFKPGDRVMCAGAGGYAEYAVADWGRVTPMPAQGLTFEQAATLPVAVATMHDALVTNGKLKPGESVMIQGASSGVGLMALQIAKLLGAGLVIGTSTNAERRAKLKEFGADLAIDTGNPAWPDEVLKATDGKGVNLIIDQVSGSVANGNLKAAAILGRIVNVGPARRRQGRVRFRPACGAPHHLYRRHAPHALGRRVARGNARDVDRSRRRHRRRQAAAADRQDVSARPGRRRAGPHEGQQALREDFADAVTASSLPGRVAPQ